MSALAASKTADAITTERMLVRGCHETDPLLGPRPSAGRVAGVNAAAFGIEATAAYFLKRYGQHHRWARHLWLIEPSRQTGLHIYWAAHNEALVCR